MGMKGIINVNLNSISGQWYADIGDYLQITADSLSFTYLNQKNVMS